MTPTDLTGTERAVLIVLMAESRPVANPELATLGPALDKPGRDKLNALGLIESERIKGRYVHELTDRGWALCRDIVARANDQLGQTGIITGMRMFCDAKRSDGSVLKKVPTPLLQLSDGQAVRHRRIQMRHPPQRPLVR